MAHCPRACMTCLTVLLLALIIHVTQERPKSWFIDTNWAEDLTDIIKYSFVHTKRINFLVLNSQAYFNNIFNMHAVLQHFSKFNISITVIEKQRKWVFFAWFEWSKLITTRSSTSCRLSGCVPRKWSPYKSNRVSDDYLMILFSILKLSFWNESTML